MNSDSSTAAKYDGDGILICVRVHPRASRNKVEDVINGHLRIRTTAPPDAGKANKSVIKLLAEYLGVPKSRVSLRRGPASRSKVFHVEGPVTPPPGLIVANE